MQMTKTFGDGHSIEVKIAREKRGAGWNNYINSITYLTKVISILSDRIPGVEIILKKINCKIFTVGLSSRLGFVGLLSIFALAEDSKFNFASHL